MMLEPTRAAYRTLRTYIERNLVTPYRCKYRQDWLPRLEIGPGADRLPGFSSLNVVWRRNVDYVADASSRLPFPSNAFALIYASHILEHIPWYKLEPTLSEWFRVIRPGGSLEVWVPDALKISIAFVAAENGVESEIGEDGWFKFNEDRDPCTWMNGRVFSYGDGTGKKTDPNWHMSLLSPRYLEKLMKNAGFQEVQRMDSAEVRGFNHGWINLGMRGIKY